MTIKDRLIEELQTLPEALVAELLEHARSLRERSDRSARETAVASEPCLARDWMRPEEEEAWKDL